jgi:hypothetical protein
MSELAEEVQEAAKSIGEIPLNRWIALLVAVAATILAIGNVKDGNIVQSMAQAQVKSVDYWAYYQAKSTRQHLAEQEEARYQVQLADPGLARELRAAVSREMERTHADAVRLAAEKDEVQAKAESFEKEYDALNFRDDQFDIAQACLTLAIALLGITALTRRLWLFFFGAAMMAAGTTMCLAGFLGWRIHPDWIARLLQ